MTRATSPIAHTELGEFLTKHGHHGGLGWFLEALGFTTMDPRLQHNQNRSRIAQVMNTYLPPVIEVTQAGRTVRRTGSIAYRRAAHRHRVELLRDAAGHEKPCWTVIITGPRRRRWGFWCPRTTGPDHFVPWQDFGAGGCGELTETIPQHSAGTTPNSNCEGPS